MEEFIHMFAETMERDPTLDVFCADGDNAFNAANRIRGLREVKENFPAALAYAKDMYLEESTAWYHGLPDNIKPVFCRNGYHQGDVMTIQPLLVHIKAMIQSKFPDEWFLVKFYVDDGNFIAPSKIMREIIKILQNSHLFNLHYYLLNFSFSTNLPFFLPTYLSVLPLLFCYHIIRKLSVKPEVLMAHDICNSAIDGPRN